MTTHTVQIYRPLSLVILDLEVVKITVSPLLEVLDNLEMSMIEMLTIVTMARPLRTQTINNETVTEALVHLPLGEITVAPLTPISLLNLVLGTENIVVVTTVVVGPGMNMIVLIP